MRFDIGCPLCASAFSASKSVVATASVSSVAGDADPRFGVGMISERPVSMLSGIKRIRQKPVSYQSE